MTEWITIAGYLSFVLAGVIVWLATRNKKSGIASLGELFGRVLHHRATRVAIMLAWWWVGWHFLVNIVGR